MPGPDGIAAKQRVEDSLVALLREHVVVAVLHLEPIEKADLLVDVHGRYQELLADEGARFRGPSLR